MLQKTGKQEHAAPIMLKIKTSRFALQVSLSVQAEGELLGGLCIISVDSLTSDYGSGGDSMKSKLLFFRSRQAAGERYRKSDLHERACRCGYSRFDDISGGGQVMAKDTYAYYLLEYGMYTDAENTYQGKSVNLDIAVERHPGVETDGFGRADYDEEATFPVTDSGSFVTALERGGLVSAVSGFTWDEAVTMAGGTQSVLNLEQDAVITVTARLTSTGKPSHPSGDGQDGAGYEFRARIPCPGK